MSLEKTKNKIAIIGNQSITKYLINYLQNKGIKINYLITLKNKKKYNVTDPYNFKNEKIKIIEVETYSLISKNDKKKLKQLDIDFLIVFGWSRLIPQWTLELAKKSTIGVHAGILSPPRSRGRAVFNWALIGGFKKMIYYAMRLKSGIDNGDIFEKKTCKINLYDDIESLYFKNSIISSEFFFKIITNWKFYSKKARKQNNSGSSYFPKRNPDDGFINWRFSSLEISNLVRALKTPYPNAFTFYKSKKIYINDAIPFEINTKIKCEIGEIVEVFPNNKFVVRCNNSFLLVKNFTSSKNLIH